MATITLTRGNTLHDSSAKSDFHNLVDQASASISNIENADVSNSAAIAASKLNLATVAQNIAMSGKVINYAKGSDIASATTTDIGAATGNFIDITGTTTIEGLGTVQAGTIRFVRFTGILTLTHNGTSLILPTTANITTAANDRAIFASLGSGNWICLAYQRADGTPVGSAYTPTPSNALAGSVIQSKMSQTAAADSSTTALPVDNSAPSNSEGKELTALDVTLTAGHADNILECELVIWLKHNSGQNMGFTILQGTTVIGAGYVLDNASFGNNQGVLRVKTTAGSTSSQTFHVRYGPSSSGTAYCNTDASNTITFGGSLFMSSLTVKEIKV